MIPCIRKFTFLFLGLILLYASCVKNNDSPTSDVRAKLLGTWLVTENGKKLTYQVVITEGPGSASQIAISNFANYLATATAGVDGNTITMNTNQQLFMLILTTIFS